MFDVIVVGSGITGGLAAKELTEKGLKTLVLERGRAIEHIIDYHDEPLELAPLQPWELQRHKTQSKCYAFDRASMRYFADDVDNPYVQVRPYDWIRSYQLGGRSLVWARHCVRWGPGDFLANLNDGTGIDWPLRYEDLAPWYEYVERFVGVSGSTEGNPEVPDGVFLPPLPMNEVERHFKTCVERHIVHRRVFSARLANLTEALDGRGPCKERDLCNRGCPNAGYFNSITASLPAAQKTGNLQIRTDAVVESILFDADTGLATGVRFIDAKTREAVDVRAKLIFLNAGALDSTKILLNSKSERFKSGLGNDSDQLGRNLMDHNYRIQVHAEFNELGDIPNPPGHPGGFYIPRFQNLERLSDTRSYLRGFAYSGQAFKSAGTSSKQRWKMVVVAMGETLPNPSNRVRLSDNLKDKCRIPQLEIECKYGQNELAMLSDMKSEAEKMLRVAGFVKIEAFDTEQSPGLSAHEMGTARMGRDPSTSVLNKYNQIHSVPNVFVTDGACMASSACQNPSLTYMAITARACKHAVEELKKGYL